LFNTLNRFYLLKSSNVISTKNIKESLPLTSNTTFPTISSVNLMDINKFRNDTLVESFENTYLNNKLNPYTLGKYYLNNSNIELLGNLTNSYGHILDLFQVEKESNY
jgi:hypothetical protein